MSELIWTLLVGLVVGIIASFIMHIHGTLLFTLLIGISGSFVGGFIATLLNKSSRGGLRPGGLLASVLGAILLLYLYSHLAL